MRTFAFLAVACMGVLAGTPPLFAADPPASPAPRPEIKLEFLYLELTGVEAAEVGAVAKAMSGVEGVRSFTWTVQATEAKVVREVGKAGDAALARAAGSAGAATAGVIPIAAGTFTFEKKLHCGGCVAEVNKTLRAIKGLKESTVPAEMTTVFAVYDTRAVKPADIEAALAAIGKPARVAR